MTVTGDGPAYGLSFTVPQGEKGDAGPPGEVSQAALDAAVASLVDNAPEALDTLSELADALGNDPNFATTVSTQIGQRALIDGAPAAYNTLGKLVAALQAGELGGSTDASLLTGTLTDQVEVSDAVIQYYPEGQSEAVPTGLADAVNNAQYLGQAAYNTVFNDVFPSLEYLSVTKADADHTHTPAEVGGVANEGGADGLWIGNAANLPATGTAGVLYVTTED